MIFSIIILNFIGVEVLHLPGLGGSSGNSSQAPQLPPPPQPPTVDRAIPGSLYTGDACTANYECNQGVAISICREGTCQPILKAVVPCSEQADPGVFCRVQTGYEQSSCVAYAPNIEFCTLDDSVEERIKPYGSVPIGGKCSLSLECVQVLEFDGKTVNINPKCLNDVCELSFISSALACHTQSDPDGYCQEALSSSEAYCSNVVGEPAPVDLSKATPIPESIICQDSAYCNELYRTQDEYECHVPSGSPGVQSGTARESKTKRIRYNRGIVMDESTAKVSFLELNQAIWGGTSDQPAASRFLANFRIRGFESPVLLLLLPILIFSV